VHKDTQPSLGMTCSLVVMPSRFPRVPQDGVAFREMIATGWPGGH